MENAIDALVMAGQVLIFIVALTVCMSSFTTVRTQVDQIIGQTETVKLAKDANSDTYINYIQSKENGAERIVGAETVVSSMYRAIKENYTIYLKLKPEDYNTIDQSIVTEQAKFSRGKDKSNNNIISENDKLIKLTIGSNQQVHEILKSSIYNKIKDGKFYEYIGEYQNSNTQVNSENRLVYRVITYVKI